MANVAVFTDCRLAFLTNAATDHRAHRRDSRHERSDGRGVFTSPQDDDKIALLSDVTCGDNPLDAELAA